jgi:hypothetical protein
VGGCGRHRLRLALLRPLLAGQVEDQEDEGREGQRDDGQRRAHRGGVAELALLEGGVQQVLRDHDSGVRRAAARVESLHVDEGVEREDAEVDVRGPDGVTDHRHGDRDGGAEAPCPIDTRSLVDLGRDAFDRGDEEHHVEADHRPGDDED